jgi:hypothetical protein
VFKVVRVYASLGCLLSNFLVREQFEESLCAIRDPLKETKKHDAYSFSVSGFVHVCANLGCWFATFRLDGFSEVHAPIHNFSRLLCQRYSTTTMLVAVGRLAQPWCLTMSSTSAQQLRTVTSISLRRLNMEGRTGYAKFTGFYRAH